MSRRDRNSGMGRNFDAEYTITNICEATRAATARGSDLEDKLHSAIGSFSTFLREESRLRDLDKIELSQYKAWVESLSERVSAGNLKGGTAVDYISATNTMFQIFGYGEGSSRGLHINPAEFDLHKTRIHNEDRSIDRETVDQLRMAAWDKFRETGDIRDVAVFHMLGIGYETGLRCQEIIMNHIVGKDLSKDVVNLRDHVDGAKNGQGREFTSIRSLTWTREAQAYLQEHRHIFLTGNFIPDGSTYEKMETDVNNRLRSLNADIANDRMWHGLRHNYAHESYAIKWEARTRP